VRARFRRAPQAPLAIAGVLAVPLFFSSLMASTLALERPLKYEWRSAGKLLTTYHQPTASNEAKIWLFALLPSLILLAVGVVARLVPYGVYASCAAAIVLALGVTHRLDEWAAHHRARFPNGEDLIPRSNFASDKLAPGEWEQKAKETALSLSHWTIALAVAAAVIVVALALRRRWAGRHRVAVETPPAAGVHAPDATPPQGLTEL
jgi:hypothetical protein